MAEQIRLDVELDGILTRLKAVTAEINRVGSAQDAAFDTGAAQGVADAVNDLQKEYKQLKDSADTLKTALRGATDPQVINLYTKSIAQLELGMSKLEKSSKAAGVNLKTVSKEASTTAQVMDGLFGAVSKVTVILAAISAVKELVVSSVRLSESIKKAQKSYEAFLGSGEKANDLIERLIVVGNKDFIPTDQILEAGKSLLAFGEASENIPDVLDRIANISAATGKNFNELTTIYGKARAAGVLYAEDINQLVDAGIPIIQEFAKQMGVSNDQVKKLASEGKISFEELQLAMFNLTAEGGKFANQAATQAETIGGAWQRLKSTVSPVLQAIGDEFQEASVYWLNVAANAVEGIKGLFGGGGPVIQNDEIIDREAYNEDRREYEKQLAERERLEKEAEKARRERSKKSNEDAAKLARERTSLQIQAMQDGMAKEIAQESFRFAELEKQLKKYHLDTTDAEIQHQKNIQGIQTKYILIAIEKEAELLELRKAQGEYEKEVTQKNYDAAKKNLNDIKDVRESEVDILEAQFDNYISVLGAGGVDEKLIAEKRLEFDKRIKAERLTTEIEFQKGLLAITDAGDAAAIAQIQNRISALNEQLQGLGVSGGDAAGGGTLKEQIFKIFDVPKESEKDFENAINVGIDALQRLSDARVQAAEVAVQAAEKETQAAEDKVQAANDALDRELELAELGFASNVTNAQRALALAEQQEAAARQKEKKAIEEKKKAQRAQILLDSSLQAANLATSATNIFRTLSTLGPFGIALGVTTIALMIGAFIKSKAAALQAVKAKEGIQGRIGDSGIVVGPSHDSGGVPLEVEGGEFVYQNGKRISVVNKKATAAHFGLLQAINKDDRPMMARYLDQLTGGISRSVDAPTGGMSYSSGYGDRTTHDLLRENNRLQKRIIELEESRPEIVDMGDHIERRVRGRIEKIKKRGA